VGDYPASWAGQTLEALQQLVRDGIECVNQVCFEEWLTEEGFAELQEELKDPSQKAAYWWRNLPGINFRIEPFEAPVRRNVPPHGDVVFTRRIRFDTVVARMSDYLGYLQERACRSKHTAVLKQWVDDLKPLSDEYHTVFNCTGWGSKTLCGHDPSTAEMRLLAGMVCRVDNDSVSTAISLHRGPFRQTPLYIVPRSGSATDVICGGTAIEIRGVPDPRKPVEAPEPQLWQDIMERCRKVEPLLRMTDPQVNLCGLRPVRDRVRVEVDPDRSNLIHCYGHGGAGLTLSWGSARAAVALMSDDGS
jgi:D-amino-acid oxidase